MADDRWNESRNLWGRERRLDRERQRPEGRGDYGQEDYMNQRHYRPRPSEDLPENSGYRAFGEDGPIYAGDHRAHAGDGRPYGGRYNEIPPRYRDFELNQRRIHRGDYDPDRYTPNPRDGRGEEARSWWDRTQDAVSSWFGDDEARRRHAWDERRAGLHAQEHGEHRGRGPKGYRRSDERILHDINDRLTDDPYLDASEIEVSVLDGEATLAGFVFRREDKRRAEDLAERASGVTHVQNNLRLQPGATDMSGAAPTDVRF